MNAHGPGPIAKQSIQCFENLGFDCVLGLGFAAHGEENVGGALYFIICLDCIIL